MLFGEEIADDRQCVEDRVSGWRLSMHCSAATGFMPNFISDKVHGEF
jgi:hypothetical protein